MDLKALQDYSEWLKTSPSEVLKAVKNVRGGWKTVFPDHLPLPLWAHRVRNFFNREPKSLLRLAEVQSKALIGRIERESPPDKIAEKYALSDDVYRDAQNWHWYQMNEGGTIYHWGSKPRVTWIEGPFQEGKEKLGIPVPVFKLVAPDGTGGSRETILRNIHRIFVAVKQENFLAYIAHMTVKDDHDRGSYNYSETVKAGFNAHEMRDIVPHEKYDFPNVYLNPPDPYPFSSPSDRRFPETDNLGRPLARQVNGV